MPNNSRETVCGGSAIWKRLVGMKLTESGKTCQTTNHMVIEPGDNYVMNVVPGRLISLCKRGKGVFFGC